MKVIYHAYIVVFSLSQVFKRKNLEYKPEIQDPFTTNIFKSRINELFVKRLNNWFNLIRNAMGQNRKSFKFYEFLVNGVMIAYTPYIMNTIKEFCKLQC